ncbi:hypothetical protein NSB31_29680 [Bacillus cereus]|uniref:hypothetical protein n=1 Tax=Bacillota TaxID=1239 RepID=UPI00214A4477|nr:MULTISPECIES: hypothetical protein [Bacillota]MCR1953160.1 hypothetical protein [Clostridium sp. DSM 100503]MCR2013825.1 hypothetical protein [Bacillus cereus]
MRGKFINYRKCEGCNFESEEDLTKSYYECGLMVIDEKNDLEIICLYMDKSDNEIKERKFDGFSSFGKWVADNVTEVILIDIIQEEE